MDYVELLVKLREKALECININDFDTLDILRSKCEEVLFDLNNSIFDSSKQKELDDLKKEFNFLSNTEDWILTRALLQRKSDLPGLIQNLEDELSNNNLMIEYQKLLDIINRYNNGLNRPLEEQFDDLKTIDEQIEFIKEHGNKIALDDYMKYYDFENDKFLFGHINIDGVDVFYPIEYPVDGLRDLLNFPYVTLLVNDYERQKFHDELKNLKSTVQKKNIEHVNAPLMTDLDIIETYNNDTNDFDLSYYTLSDGNTTVVYPKNDFFNVVLDEVSARCAIILHDEIEKLEFNKKLETIKKQIMASRDKTLEEQFDELSNIDEKLEFIQEHGSKISLDDYMKYYDESTDEFLFDCVRIKNTDMYVIVPKIYANNAKSLKSFLNIPFFKIVHNSLEFIEFNDRLEHLKHKGNDIEKNPDFNKGDDLLQEYNNLKTTGEKIDFLRHNANIVNTNDENFFEIYGSFKVVTIDFFNDDERYLVIANDISDDLNEIDIMLKKIPCLKLFSNKKDAERFVSRLRLNKKLYDFSNMSSLELLNYIKENASFVDKGDLCNYSDKYKKGSFTAKDGIIYYITEKIDTSLDLARLINKKIKFLFVCEKEDELSAFEDKLKNMKKVIGKKRKKVSFLQDSELKEKGLMFLNNIFNKKKNDASIDDDTKNIVVCSNCGAQNDEQSKFCCLCGSKIDNNVLSDFGRRR